MSIDTTFHPITETYVVDNSAPVQIPNAGMRGATTFRIRNVNPSNATVAYISWGPKAAGLVAAAPGLGVPVSNTIGITGNFIEVLEVPPNSFFVGNVAFSAGAAGFEITGGIGGSSA